MRESRRRFLRGAVVAVLLSAIAIGVVGSPGVRMWILTEPEKLGWTYFDPRPQGGSGPFQVEYRVLRFGKDAGERHGPLRASSAAGTVLGNYDRGKPCGMWSGFDPHGEPLWEGVPLQPGEYRVHRLLEVTVESDAECRWRLSGVLRGAWLGRGAGEFVIAERAGDRVRIREGSFEEEPLFEHMPFEVGSGVLLEVEAGGAALRGIGHQWNAERDGLWTWFDGAGNPVEQIVYLVGQELRVKRAPPWFDVLSTLDASEPILDPETGERVE